jgi:5-carboxymethyl-2-hydroxymuconate isomerase
MPHLIIEHSSNVATQHGGPIDVPSLARCLHRAALDTGIAPLDALRTRVSERPIYVIADGEPDNMFIAVTARLGAGRSEADQQRLVTALMAALDSFLGDAQRTMMLSVEYQEIDDRRRINKNNLRAAVSERASAERVDHAEGRLSPRPAVTGDRR